MNSWWNTSNSWFLFLGCFVFGCSPHQLRSDKNKLAFKCCCGGALSAVRTTKTGLCKKLGEDSVLLLDRDCFRSQVA